MQHLPLILSILFGVGAVGYIALIHKRPFKGDWVIKALPALSLAAMSFLFVPGTIGILLGAGFVLSALGDISLTFEGDKFFIGGLVSFLLAHVMYIVTFAQGSAWTLQYGWLLGVLAVFGIAMVWVLSPHLGPMRIPVYVYITVILSMDIMAVLQGGPNAILLIAGALVFTLSDTLLALDRFRKPIPGGHYWVMVTYYIAQALICMAHLCGTDGASCPL